MGEGRGVSRRKKKNGIGWGGREGKRGGKKGGKQRGGWEETGNRRGGWEACWREWKKAGGGSFTRGGGKVKSGNGEANKKPGKNWETTMHKNGHRSMTKGADKEGGGRTGTEDEDVRGQRLLRSTGGKREGTERKNGK